VTEAHQPLYADPDSAGKVLATLQTPVKKSFDRVKADLSEIHAALKDYGAALPKVHLHSVLSAPASIDKFRRPPKTNLFPPPRTMRSPPIHPLSIAP